MKLKRVGRHLFRDLAWQRKIYAKLKRRERVALEKPERFNQV